MSEILRKNKTENSIIDIETIGKNASNVGQNEWSDRPFFVIHVRYLDRCGLFCLQIILTTRNVQKSSSFASWHSDVLPYYAYHLAKVFSLFQQVLQYKPYR